MSVGWRYGVRLGLRGAGSQGMACRGPGEASVSMSDESKGSHG